MPSTPPVRPSPHPRAETLRAIDRALYTLTRGATQPPDDDTEQIDDPEANEHRERIHPDHREH